MRATNWSNTTDFSEACRRAGGRRRYNARRKQSAFDRLGRVVELLAVTGFDRGYQSEIARRLGVSRSTICRDLQVLTRLEQGWTIEQIHEVRRAERCGLHW